MPDLHQEILNIAAIQTWARVRFKILESFLRCPLTPFWYLSHKLPPKNGTRNSNTTVLYIQIETEESVGFPIYVLRKSASGYPLCAYHAGCSVDTVPLYLLCLFIWTIKNPETNLCHMDSARQKHMGSAWGDSFCACCWYLPKRKKKIQALKK